MKTNTTNTHAKPSAPQTPVKAKRLKLGIDVHADSYRVVRQFDNATPQPAQKFTPKAFLEWARRQLELADEVHSCYEAGPFGYKLHRELVQLGICNVVIRPQDWDQRGGRPCRGSSHKMTYQLPLLGSANPALSHPRYPFPNQPFLTSYLGQPQKQSHAALTYLIAATGDQREPVVSRV